jgi:hypothetical protein
LQRVADVLRVGRGRRSSPCSDTPRPSRSADDRIAAHTCRSAPRGTGAAQASTTCTKPWSRSHASPPAGRQRRQPREGSPTRSSIDPSTAAQIAHHRRCSPRSESMTVPRTAIACRPASINASTFTPCRPYSAARAARLRGRPRRRS